MLEKGLVQIYTGDGKGKTTAAFGLALRAAGQGNKVLVYQFLKPPSLATGERLAIDLKSAGISIEALDIDWNMGKSLTDEKIITQTRKVIQEVLQKLEKLAADKVYDMIILDEINFCISKKLANYDDVMRIINNRAPNVEIIMTGRGAAKELIEIADLVTEMKCIKHPFDKGIGARRGIEY